MTMTGPESWRGDAPDESEVDEAPWHEDFDLTGWPEDMAGPEYWMFKKDDDE